MNCCFLLFVGIVLGFCYATEQLTINQEEDDGGWLSDVREEEQEKHPTNPESPFVFNSDETPKEFACELFNRDQCDPVERGCNWQEICRFGEHNACYAAFTAANSTAAPDSYMVNLKGCWTTQHADDDHPGYCDEDLCFGRPQNKHPGTYFCCCKSSLCNKHLRIASDFQRTTIQPPIDLHNSRGYSNLEIFMYTIVPIVLASLLIFLAYWMFRRHRLRQYLQQAQTQMQQRHIGFDPLQQHLDIQLLEVKAKGRFGVIWKAAWGDRTVAVKQFPVQDVNSWVTEQQIYAIAGLRNHPNILKYLAADTRGSTGPDAEYWIVTEFHPYGSLYDYLKTEQVTVPQAMRLAHDMMTGLAFLHDERQLDDGSWKPSIVHRDFKSRNVLVKEDLSACVADFGLALKCEHGSAGSGSEENAGGFAQVGTRRYMAPEVLEGATEFTAFAFRQIDVYAAALVLWELLSRTRMADEAVGEHKLPFEDEVGSHPTLSDMQDCVVERKKRPPLHPAWKAHPKLRQVVTTLEEMWEMEPDGRLTAGCAAERFRKLLDQPQSANHPILPSSDVETVPLMAKHAEEVV